MSQLQNSLQYEYVFEHNNMLYARLFNPETKTTIMKTYSHTEYVPPIYLPCKEQSSFKSFTNNENLTKKTFNNVWDLNKSIKNYKDLNIDVYGNNNRSQHYIAQNFPNTLNSNHKFRTWFLDIEVRSINGYASTSNPIEEISLIQIYDSFSETFYLLATKECEEIPTSEFGQVKYVNFSSEVNMLNAFTRMVQKLDPTVICGFNSNFFDIPYITNRMKLIGMNPNELSPIRVITERQANTMEKIEYTHYDWVGRYLLDYRELFVKYSFDKLPKYSLEVVATHVLGTGKVKHDEFESLEELYLKNYNTFVQYGLTDIELLLQMDNKLKMIDTAKLIGYTCGVNTCDVFGTLKQWQNFVYNEAIKIGKVLPLQQMYTDKEAVYVGGWVKSTPGKHEWVVSFDFSSLYPSNIRTMNIGVDTLVKENELPQELRELKNKYFSYYTLQNLHLIESANNNPHEFEFFKQIIANKDHITPVLEKYNVCITPNGKFYRKSFQSVFASLMARLYADRKVEQKQLKEVKGKIQDLKEKLQDIPQEMLDAQDYHDLMQFILKIMLNSSYGSTALDYNAFSFGKGMASSITTTGRLANRWVAYRVNEKIVNILGKNINIDNVPYTIQADTDSNYFSIGELVNLESKRLLNKSSSELTLEEGTKICKDICDNILEPVIIEAISEVTHTLNAYDHTILTMEQETTADRFISVADKRYFCRYDNYGKSKYKITGLSLIGKSTPTWCKEKLKPVLELIADKSSAEVLKYVESVEKEFVSQPLKDICVIKGVSSIDYNIDPNDGKYKRFSPESGKFLSAPFHSRGAIVHNSILDEKNDNTYTRIKPGDKIYIVPLVVPNPFYNQNVICFINPNFIDEFNVLKYVDYDTMFQKNFLKNIELITTPINWSLNKFQNLLDEWE